MPCQPQSYISGQNTQQYLDRLINCLTMPCQPGSHIRTKHWLFISWWRDQHPLVNIKMLEPGPCILPPSNVKSAGRLLNEHRAAQRNSQIQQSSSSSCTAMHTFCWCCQLLLRRLWCMLQRNVVSRATWDEGNWQCSTPSARVLMGLLSAGMFAFFK